MAQNEIKLITSEDEQQQEDLHLEKAKAQIGDLATWTRQVVDCPQQSSGQMMNDGMFVLKFAECECYDNTKVNCYNHYNNNLRTTTHEQHVINDKTCSIT
jgi:Ulp1 family protease